MPLPKVTIEGRMAADPELRFSPSGTAICTLRVVAAQQKRNEAGEWVDDKVLWIDATVWKQMGEHAAESLKKGELVVLTGRLETQEWTTEGGDKRSKIMVQVDDIGPSLRFREIPHGAGKAERATASDRPAQNDPWASGSPASDEPPF